MGPISTVAAARKQGLNGVAAAADTGVEVLEAGETRILVFVPVGSRQAAICMRSACSRS